MTATVTYQYIPNDVVWVIDDLVVKDGVVLRVVITVTGLKTEIMYDVRLNGEFGTLTISEADVFDNVDLALAEYKTRITS